MAEQWKAPWADWTPEQAEAALEVARGNIVPAYYSELTEEERLDNRIKLYNWVEGYHAQRKMNETLERNAPLFSKAGLRRVVRQWSPNAMRSRENNRPEVETLAQSYRDAVTILPRMGKQWAGTFAMLPDLVKGTATPEQWQRYEMGNVDDKLFNDPVTAALLLPGGIAAQGLTKGAALAEGAAGKAGEKIAGKIGEKVLGKVGSFAGEAGALAGMEYAGNLGDVSGEEAAAMGLVGTGLGRVLSGAVSFLGKGAKETAKAGTRNKYNFTKTDVTNKDLTGRTFNGTELKEPETVMLESGDMGRVSRDAAESIAGQGSGWEARVSKAYKDVAKNQNSRLVEGLEKSPEFQNNLDRAGVNRQKVSENIGKGQDPQDALAIEMNRTDGELNAMRKKLDDLENRMSDSRLSPAYREHLESQYKPLLREYNARRAALDAAAEYGRQNGFGVVSRESFAVQAEKEVGDMIGQKGNAATGEKGLDAKIDVEQAAGAQADIREIEDVIDRDVQHILGTRSGKYIPMSDFRKQVQITTRSKTLKANGELYEKGNLDIAKEGMKRVKRRIDQDQSKGELGDTARSESFRFGVSQGLDSIQPKVDNMNRYGSNFLTNIIKRSPAYDKALTRLYKFGTKLAPRTIQENTARQSILLQPEAGGEWGDLFRAAFQKTGRVAPAVYMEAGETGDRVREEEKALANIDAFVAEVNSLKGASK